MKKVNLEIMLKLFILLGFSTFYFILVRSDMITLYVHPRIIPFAKFSIVAMMFIVLFLVFDILKARTVKRKMRNYIVFIIPFVMMLGMKPNSTNMGASNNSKFIEDKSDNVDSAQNNNISSAEPKNGNDNKKISIDENGKITVTDSNYINFLTEVENNIDSYINKEIEIVGFVYKEDGMKSNQFALVRNMMVCCTADMQMVGLLCDNAEPVKYEVDTWLKVNGTLELGKRLEEKVAIIKVKNIEKVDAPKTPYVYPY
ncbi:MULTISPECIES: TIGR03943 family protein [Clostridium]|uniref:TIGR03943 family protein n=1 Tax=Clostridium cibarium TaxID=2762247 RepID=A0ABR8PVE3_9CLOT|nr:MULTISPECIES: TIGR03943 family protein [Clostridium]MBD7912146.1 TIGR03943 family protein [Clostridium cibarium]